MCSGARTGGCLLQQPSICALSVTKFDVRRDFKIYTRKHQKIRNVKINERDKDELLGNKMRFCQQDATMKTIPNKSTEHKTKKETPRVRPALWSSGQRF
jgi:hypothetical protein